MQEECVFLQLVSKLCIQDKKCKLNSYFTMAHVKTEFLLWTQECSIWPANSEGERWADEGQTPHPWCWEYKMFIQFILFNKFISNRCLKMVLPTWLYKSHYFFNCTAYPIPSLNTLLSLLCLKILIHMFFLVDLRWKAFSTSSYFLIPVW